MLCKKEVAFEFFKRNPQVLYEKGENNNYKLIGVKSSTYKRYIYEYRSIHEANIEIKPKKENRDKYFKNRLRQKFVFDDSSLFSC